MQKKSFSEEEFRSISEKVIPVLDELRKIAADNGVEDCLRIYIGKEFASVEGSGLNGWEICNYGGKYEMKYELRVPFEKSKDN